MKCKCNKGEPGEGMKKIESITYIFYSLENAVEFDRMIADSKKIKSESKFKAFIKGKKKKEFWK